MSKSNSNKKIDFNKLNENQQVNYVKNLLFNHDLTFSLDILLKEEKKDLRVIKIILKVLKEELIIDRIKQECNIKDSIMPYVYSKIISLLAFYNKQNVLNAFFKSLDDNTLKSIAYYEYQNRTLVSISCDVFKKYCSKYKKEAKNSLNMDNTEKLMLTTGIEKYNYIYNKKTRNKNRLIYVLYLILVILIVASCLCFYGVNKAIKEYDGLVFNGIYIGDINLSKTKLNDLEIIIDKEKEKIEQGKIIVKNINENQVYTYKDLGIKVDSRKALDDIQKYNNNLSWIKKASMLNEKKRYKTFYLESNFIDKNIDDFVLRLEQRFNTEVVEDGLKVDSDYNVYYDKGKSGFKLDYSKTKEVINEALSALKEEQIIEVVGNVIEQDPKNKSLSVINKKVSSHTTYFENVGNRGHNIVLAASRLNKTLLNPKEVFSYLKTVGPYNYDNGYRPAPVYINGKVATANGGGVCQLTSTLYNAQLKAGLETVYRTNHIFAPDYVDKGLDATVYSTTTDFKFKNQYDYPIFIVSYVKGNYLTVDIWTNKDALGGKTYEPYSVYSNGAWLSFLKTIKDGKVIETKYLDKSYYKSH